MLRGGSVEDVAELVDAATTSRGTEGLRTLRGRRQSRANSSLKPKFPASREFTGNFIASGLRGAPIAAKTDV
jgi:hypothetical protein